ncbi:TonB-dependent receptor [Sphingomonas sp. S1-29]|uniref:TonB-dependent receptor domain-containing protein n=1 Tax=Sphingomonas sp. S1-29 TaxID=2991074 RepID=UPI0022407503|nr:TonB-dependent receptor [Sphingomonas sp. S1-29]UZK68109.1 TonB-dependent receptor [Sphingomonas sp. S1-29]
MKKLTRQRLLASTLMIGATVVAAPAFAQVAPQSTETVTEQPNTGSPTENVQDEAAITGQDIVVTGSLIRNPNLIASNPVSVIGADEIDLQQANVAEELLRELPGVVPSIGSAVNNGNGGASFVNLRGLGSNRNLVLLDGVRLVPGTLQGQFDLNNVPLALVQRVDVLTGGASTTYGADAISGVVNFITRTDFAGIDLNLSNQISEQGDGAIFRADLTVGANFDDGRGNAVLSIGYQQADPVFQGDRAISRFQVDSFTGGIGGSGTSVPSRFTGVNPTGADSITSGCGAAGQIACNAVQGNRQVNAAGNAFRPTAAFTPFNFNPDNIFQTPFERYNIYAAANYQISDNVEVYNRAIFSKNTVSTIIAPSGAFAVPVTVGLNNPFLSGAQRSAFCGFDTNAGVGYTPRFTAAECTAAATATGRTDPNYREVTGVQLSRRATEVGPRVSDYTTTFFDYRAGVRGDITSNIGYDLFGSYGESENFQLIQGYTLNSRVQQSLLVNRDPATGTVTCQNDANGCVPVNFFGAEGSITPDTIDFLTGNSSVLVRTTQAQARGTINGDFGFASPLATENISFAVGGEYRKYTASQESDSLSQGGDLGGAGGAAPNIQGGYDVYEAIGELIVPLVADRPFFNLLQVEGGVRYSSYTVDAAGDPSYNTTTWKVGGQWEPFDGIKFRGNYSRAVRAPNIGELFSPVNTTLTNLADDPCANLTDEGLPIGGRPTPTGVLRDVCIAQGAPASSIGQIAVPTSGQAQSTGGGNVNLLPEDSDSWSAGAVFTPSFLPGFSASIDYYHITVDGAVSSPTPDDVVSACFDSLSVTNPACLAIRRNPIDGSLSGDPSTTLGLPITLSNLGFIKTDGVDLTANYTRDFGIFGLSLGFTGNWTNRSQFNANASSEDSILRECVGLYSANCASIQPEFSWSQRTTLSFDDVDVSLLWRHIDRVDYEFADIAEDAAFAGTIDEPAGTYDFNTIEPYDYFDLTVRYAVTENFTFSIAAMNMFDKQPPLVGNTIGSTAYNSGNTYPSTYDAVGRRFSASARIRF